MSYGPLSVFFIGMLHGIGAETGTQVLLIAAVGGAASHGLGAAMLVAFVAGLLVSNTAVALIATSGFYSSARARPLYMASGVVAGAFSLVVGTFFLLGQEHNLPNLQLALRFP